MQVPGGGSEGRDGARRPVWAWLADWLTEEVPERGASGGTRPEAPVPPAARGGGPPDRGRGAPTLGRRAARGGRGARRRIAASPGPAGPAQAAGQGARPALRVAAAVGGGALVAMLALLLHGTPASRATLAGQGTPAATAGHSAAPARTGGSSAGAPAPASARTAPSASPDCASMHMEPVPPAPGSSAPPVAGLCYSLGNGQDWVVGCAPGFQASCDPALDPVLACLRRLGAAARGGITAGDVEACAAGNSA